MGQSHSDSSRREAFVKLVHNVYEVEYGGPVIGFGDLTGRKYAQDTLRSRKRWG